MESLHFIHNQLEGVETSQLQLTFLILLPLLLSFFSISKVIFIFIIYVIVSNLIDHAHHIRRIVPWLITENLPVNTPEHVQRIEQLLDQIERKLKEEYIQSWSCDLLTPDIINILEEQLSKLFREVVLLVRQRSIETHNVFIDLINTAYLYVESIRQYSQPEQWTTALTASLPQHKDKIALAVRSALRKLSRAEVAHITETLLVEILTENIIIGLIDYLSEQKNILKIVILIFEDDPNAVLQRCVIHQHRTENLDDNVATGLDLSPLIPEETRLPSAIVPDDEPAIKCAIEVENLEAGDEEYVHCGLDSDSQIESDVTLPVDKAELKTKTLELENSADTITPDLNSTVITPTLSSQTLPKNSSSQSSDFDVISMDQLDGIDEYISGDLAKHVQTVKAESDDEIKKATANDEYSLFSVSPDVFRSALKKQNSVTKLEMILPFMPVTPQPPAQPANQQAPALPVKIPVTLQAVTSINQAVESQPPHGPVCIQAPVVAVPHHLSAPPAYSEQTQYGDSDNIKDDPAVIPMTALMPAMSVAAEIGSVSSNTTSQCSGDSGHVSERRFLQISIPSFETIQERGSSTKYVVYCIIYHAVYHNETDPSEISIKQRKVYRRYREFNNLQTRLEKEPRFFKLLKKMKGPKWYQQIRFKMTDDDINKRRYKLELFLQQLLDSEEINLSDEFSEFLAYKGEGQIEFVKEKTTLIPPAARIDKMMIRTVSSLLDRVADVIPKHSPQTVHEQNRTEPKIIEEGEDSDRYEIRVSSEPRLEELINDFNLSSTSIILEQSMNEGSAVTSESIDDDVQLERLVDKILEWFLFLVLPYSSLFRNELLYSKLRPFLRSLFKTLLHEKIAQLTSHQKVAHLMELAYETIWPTQPPDELEYDITKLSAAAISSILSLPPAAVRPVLTLYLKPILNELITITAHTQTNQVLLVKAFENVLSHSASDLIK